MNYYYEEAQKFAEKYLNRRVTIHTTNRAASLWSDTTPAATGKIIGWYKAAANVILVQRDDTDKDLVNIWDVVINGTLPLMVSRYYIYDLELVVDPIKVTIYPHKCNYCKAPARRCGKSILCSNIKCKKSRYVLKKSIKYTVPPKLPIEQPKNTNPAFWWTSNIGSYIPLNYIGGNTGTSTIITSTAINGSTYTITGTYTIS